MAEIEYPGVAKLVSRLVWECRGCIRDRVRRNAAKPCDACVCGAFPDCRKRQKAALTTGMTTDRKNFDFPSRRGIMAEIEYPGIAKLVSRLVWENTTSRINKLNNITGCSAVGSAPALGAGCRRFESCHSDHLSQKNRLKRRFFCVISSIFEVCLTTSQLWPER